MFEWLWWAKKTKEFRKRPTWESQGFICWEWHSSTPMASRSSRSCEFWQTRMWLKTNQPPIWTTSSTYEIFKNCYRLLIKHPSLVSFARGRVSAQFCWAAICSGRHVISKNARKVELQLRWQKLQVVPRQLTLGKLLYEWTPSYNLLKNRPNRRRKEPIQPELLLVIVEICSNKCCFSYTIYTLFSSPVVVGLITAFPTCLRPQPLKLLIDALDLGEAKQDHMSIPKCDRS